MHRVVILGGGFGGIYAAQALRNAPVQVTLVDRRNFHLFQPLLYQVATGSLSPGEISSPIRTILRRQKNVRVILAYATGIDARNRKLLLSDGDSIAYDTLIVATGAQNYYFGNEGWHQVAPGLKSIEDATAIRHKILYAFEAAERESDAERRTAWLTFVIVGAGPTGVELSGALGEISRDTLRHDFRSIRPEQARILLLEGSRHVLPAFPEHLSVEAERSLIKLGVRPRCNVRVVSIDERGVTLGTGERIESRTVVWAAGVRASAFAHVLEEDAGAKLTDYSQIVVEPDLSIAGHPEIFVIGDLMHLKQNGKPLPGTAPVAIQQGRYVARVIKARLRDKIVESFWYHDKGMLAVIGRKAGVGLIGRLQVHGAIAWLAWLLIHLTYLAQFRNRLIVFIRWGFQYVAFDRGARLITGKSESLD